MINLFSANKIETDANVKQQLISCGIEKVDFTGVPIEYQNEIANAVTSMCSKYPELKGYIGGMYVGNLRSGVLACAGPTSDDSGFSTEIIISREAFTSANLEHRLNQMSRTKLNGQRWLAGRGIQGVIKHEMSHLLHLKMISDSYDVSPNQRNHLKLHNIEQDYMHNTIVTNMCYSAIRELGIHPNDIARNLSTYGAHDFGECFAEAISEYETAEYPRRLCTLIHEKYIKRRNERSGQHDNIAT